MSAKPKTTIGRVERVKFPDLNNLTLHARIDTGAKTSSINVASVKETAKGLVVTFLDASNNKTPELNFPHYERVAVVSSMGHRQVRYKVKLSIVMRKRRIKTSFTLADRSKQVYPVLIGRRALNRKFVVDVSMGVPLSDKEAERTRQLQSAIVSEEKI